MLGSARHWQCYVEHSAAGAEQSPVKQGTCKAWQGRLMQGHGLASLRGGMVQPSVERREYGKG